MKRAGNTGKLGKGGRGMLKRASHRTAGILAMRAATGAAVTGAVDGVHGADPTGEFLGASQIIQCRS